MLWALWAETLWARLHGEFPSEFFLENIEKYIAYFVSIPHRLTAAVKRTWTRTVKTSVRSARRCRRRRCQFCVVQKVPSLNEAQIEENMASREAVRRAVQNVRPILSVDREEARKRVLNLYKAWYRQIPYIGKFGAFRIRECVLCHSSLGSSAAGCYLVGWCGKLFWSRA